MGIASFHLTNPKLRSLFHKPRAEKHFPLGDRRWGSGHTVIPLLSNIDGLRIVSR